MPPADHQLLAGVELGGTKVVALLGRGPDIVDSLRVPTTTPAATLSAVTEWLAAARARHGGFGALGIASFGPLDLDPGSRDFGTITATPKPGWQGTALAAYFGKQFAVPIAIDTDVNGAALAEGRWGAAQGLASHAYLTIGTGVGAGIVAGGRTLQGRSHPEFGHIRVRRSPEDCFAGHCPFHGDCLEGLIAGPALAARSGRDPAGIPAGDPLWDAVRADLAEALAILCLTVSPQRILIGGSVGLNPALDRHRLRQAVDARLAGYLPPLPADAIAAPALGDRAGPLGAIALAMTVAG